MTDPTAVSTAASTRARGWLTIGILLTLAASLALWLTRGGPTDPQRGAREASDNLLTDARITRCRGIRHCERLVDGSTAVEGDPWHTTLTAVVTSGQSFAEFDLGERRPIAAALVQGDNNDVYTLWTSDDGTEYRYLWSAPQVPAPGLRTRVVVGLDTKARYLKVTVGEGDTRFSLGEIAVYAQTPNPFPPTLIALRGENADDVLRVGSLWFGAAMIGFVLISGRALPLSWNLSCLLLPLLGSSHLWRALDEAWPAGSLEISFLRALSGTIAAAVVARESLVPPALRWLRRRFVAPPGREPDFGGQPAYLATTLAACALMALATFANLGSPQFWDHGRQQPTVIHSFDMRVYYPTAKYFEELRYDGVYRASLMAYVDDTPGLTLAAVGDIPLRDLVTHRLTLARDVAGEIVATRARFSPARWRDFVADMRYFREAMGPADYLGSLGDHGANATPAWMAVAHLLLAGTQASDAVLLAGAALDPLLLLVAFIAIGRVFGLRSMLLCMVVFGATDYSVFGSNWFGSTLRHDWMALLALGVCALKRQRWLLAGALLAAAASIRAFPTLALCGVAIPAVWWAADGWKTDRRLPAPRELWRAQRPALETLLGATLCVAVLLAVSSVMFGSSAWVEWFHKVRLLTSAPQINHVSLRTLVSHDSRYTLEALRQSPPPDATDWAAAQDRTFHERSGLFLLGVASYLTAVALASRRRRPEQAAVLGLTLVSVLFYPANYYAHLVFLLPLLAAEPGSGRPLETAGAMIWTAVTAMCAVQYWSVLAPGVDQHFHRASLILMTTLAVILLTLLLDDRRRHP